MLMSLYRINTAQRNWFSLHRHAGHSLLKQQSLQLDLGYEVNERVVILAHVGLERVVGNDETAKVMQMGHLHQAGYGDG